MTVSNILQAVVFAVDRKARCCCNSATRETKWSGVRSWGVPETAPQIGAVRSRQHSAAVQCCARL